MAGCSKPAVQEPAATPTATLYQPQVQTNAVDVTNTLLGFIIPDSQDIALCTAMHGFLRTAENLGYPAKLYHAATGAQSVAAVERAAADGCKGLLIGTQRLHAGALKKAALSIRQYTVYNGPARALPHAWLRTLGYTEKSRWLAVVWSKGVQTGKTRIWPRTAGAYGKFVLP